MANNKVSMENMEDEGRGGGARERGMRGQGACMNMNKVLPLEQAKQVGSHALQAIPSAYQTLPLSCDRMREEQKGRKVPSRCRQLGGAVGEMVVMGITNSLS